MKHSNSIRNRWSSRLHMRFLIISVATVLVIRFYLASTGYPQVGGGGLHISHMLWGGLFMLLALLLAFPTRYIQSWMALLGGLGFGFFIDELGKFLTSDNNYFFQPTLAIIYIIFVLLLLLGMLLERSSHTPGRARQAEALHILAETAPRGLHEQDKQEVLRLLHMQNPEETSIDLLADTIERMPVMPDVPQGQLTSVFQRFVASSSYVPTLIIFFASYILFLTLFGFAHLTAATDFVKIAWISSSLVSGVMILIGVLSLRRSQSAAGIWFRRAILASILLTTFFLFSIPPLSVAALEELLVNFIVLALIDSTIYSR